MKKIILWVILFTLTLGLIIYQSFIIRRLGTSLKQVNVINEVMKNKKDILYENLFLHWKNENGKISDSIIWDETQSSIPSSILIGKGPVLIFRFSELSCITCIDDLLKHIDKQLQNKHVNFITIGDFENPRSLLAFKIVHQLKWPMFYSKKLLTNETVTPYFFILNENGTVSELFYPDNEFPELSSQYFGIIEEKYFSNKPESSFTIFEK